MDFAFERGSECIQVGFGLVFFSLFFFFFDLLFLFIPILFSSFFFSFSFLLFPLFLHRLVRLLTFFLAFLAYA